MIFLAVLDFYQLMRFKGIINDIKLNDKNKLILETKLSLVDILIKIKNNQEKLNFLKSKMN